MPLTSEDIKKKLLNNHPALDLDEEFFEVFFLAYEAWKKAHTPFDNEEDPRIESFFDALSLPKESNRLSSQEIRTETIRQTLFPLFDTTYQNINLAFIESQKEPHYWKRQIELIPNESIDPITVVELAKLKSADGDAESFDTDEAVDNATDVAEAANDVVDSALSLSKHNLNLKLAGGMHVVNLITSAFSVVTIPALYIYQIARGQKPSFNLSNNAKWGAGAVLLTLSIVALVVPGASIAMLTAGAAFSAVISIVSFINVARERYILKKGMDTLDDQMATLAKKLKSLQEASIRIRNKSSHELTDENKNYLEQLNNEYSRTQRQLNKAAAQHQSIKTARDDLGTPFDIASYSAGIALAVGGVIAAGLLFSPLSPLIIGGIFTGLAIAGGILVTIAIVKFVVDYRERKHAAKTQPEKPVEDTEVVATIKQNLSFTASVLKKIDPDVSLDNLSQEGRLSAMAKRLETFIEEAEKKNQPERLIQFFLTFAENHAKDQPNHPDNPTAAVIFGKLPPKLTQSAKVALEKAILNPPVDEKNLTTLKKHSEFLEKIGVNLDPQPKQRLRDRVLAFSRSNHPKNPGRG